MKQFDVIGVFNYCDFPVSSRSRTLPVKGVANLFFHHTTLPE